MPKFPLASLCLFASLFLPLSAGALSTPGLSVEEGGQALTFSFAANHRMDLVEDYAVDKEGTLGFSGVHNAPRLRSGLKYQTPFFVDGLKLHFVTEHDIEMNDFEGENAEWQPRSLYAALSWADAFRLRFGLMTSHWGMGLIAHNGLTDGEAQTDLFSDPRGGDRLLRVMAVIPIPVARSAFILTADSLTSFHLGENGPEVMLGDDVLLSGDKGQQLVGAWKMRLGPMFEGGLYAVHRWQQSEDNGQLEISVADLYMRAHLEVTEGWTLSASSESAAVMGQTDWGSSPTFATHDVLQIGSAFRLGFGTNRFGLILDGLWVSGDQNFDDGTQNAFKTDRNFNQGLLLHNRLLTDISAQAPVTASNLEMTGHPAEDLNRLPTRGSITNTRSLFPKIWFKPIKDVKIYGGVLLAYTDVSLADPFQTKMSGGLPTNAYQGIPGDWLGLELDLGLKNHIEFSDLGGLDVGFEAAWLQPGDAFVNASGENLDTIFGARLFLSFQI